MEPGLRRGFWHFDQSVDPKQKPVLSLDAIGRHHLWRDAYHVRNYVHCSDAFGEALLDAELNGFGLRHYEQVGDDGQPATEAESVIRSCATVTATGLLMRKVRPLIERSTAAKL